MGEKKKYKLKELKTYASEEWLFKEKMYQSVFVEKETDWIQAELSLYNILFDEEDWKCKIRYEAYDNAKASTKKKVFSHEEEREVPKTENVIKYRSGWGNAKKTFWKKGDYIWHAYVDDELVATKEFYVDDFPLPTSESNPWFDISNIRFYEEGKAGTPFGSRKYHTQFVGKDTRYISTEFTLRNKRKDPWHCELEFFYYDAQGRLRGQATRLFKVVGETTTTTFSWGNESKNIWKDGAFTVEIIFMHQRIAIVPFNVGQVWIEGEPTIANTELINGNDPTMVPDEEQLDDLIAKLDELIGLTDIKTRIREYIEYLKFEKLRKEKGLASPKGINLHTVLTGNPGTGKTTVAKQLGKIYRAMGLLTSGHVHEVDRSDLIGEYIGQTAPKVRDAIEKARGGILFIDEAYALYRKDTANDYGHEAIEILLKEMSDGPGNLVVIVAGYPKEMTAFIESNPGLKSRFNHFFHFPDYLPEELSEIADLGFKKLELTIEQDAKNLLDQQLIKAFRSRDRSFGNARYVMSLVDESKMNMGLRLMKDEKLDDLSKEDLSTVTLDDVQDIFIQPQSKKLKLAVDNELLRLGLHELDELIGMEPVKNQIRELVKLVTYYREIGKDVLNQFVMHTVFTGNPGTGKTTVARIFAKIFKALGLIEGGHLIECDREALVAGYSGQTATKTAAVIDRAMGGVLFIDEAYALVNGPGDSFGMEAIQTILKRMEDRKTSFIVIAAGYPDNMHQFLHANPGLRSRFEKSIHFEDYNAEELLKIAEYMLSIENYKLSNEARTRLTEYLTTAFDNRDKHFGNARFVRKTIQQISRDHDLRLADIPAEKRTLKMIEEITLEDLKNLIDKSDLGGTPTIGFQRNNTPSN